jgi:hypothetical protein
MTRPDPFSISIYDGDPCCAPVASIAFHEKAKERIAHIIEGLIQGAQSRRGRVLMLRSARAGFGKSHLLARSLDGLADIAHILPVRFDREAPPSWENLHRLLLSSLSMRQTGAPLSGLSGIARQVFADLVGDLIVQGIVPAEHADRAIRGMQLNSSTMFDLQSKTSPIAEWFCSNQTALHPPMAESLANRGIGDAATCGRLLDFLFRYETKGTKTIDRAMSPPDEIVAKADLFALCRLASIQRPLVLLLDDLDAMYLDHQSGLSAAYLLTELARSEAVPLSIVSINDDLWDASFAGALPSALADRLTDQEIRLGGIGIDAARELISSRLGAANIGLPEDQLSPFQLDLEHIYQNRPGGISPREILRKASKAWLTNSDSPAASNTPLQSPESPSAPKPPAPPTPAKETLGRIRDMLQDVNQRRNANATPDDILEEPTPQPNLPAAPWAPVAATAPQALRRFAQKREQLFLGADLLFDQEAIRHTLELAGRRSPLIDYNEFDVAGATGAVRWRSPDQEILFGFEPAERTPYWRALVEQAGESPLGQAKVVAFTPPGAHGFATEGLNGHARERLDVLELDRGTLASLAAAETVIRNAESEDETFIQIAPELDFLWRRITRPMGV